MVFPKIKIKERRKSFTLKMKISKKEVQGFTLDSEELTELKRSILEDLSYEVDNLIDLMVEDEELSELQIEAFESALGKVSITVDENEDFMNEDFMDEDVAAGGDLNPSEEFSDEEGAERKDFMGDE